MAKTLTAARKAVSDAEQRLTELQQVKKTAQQKLESLETGALDISALSAAQSEVSTAERLVSSARERLSSAQSALSSAEDEAHAQAAESEARDAVAASQKALAALHTELANGSDLLEKLAEKALERYDDLRAAQASFRAAIAEYPALATRLEREGLYPAKSPDDYRHGYDFQAIAPFAVSVFGALGKLLTRRTDARAARAKAERSKAREERQKTPESPQTALEIIVPSSHASRAQQVLGEAVTGFSVLRFRNEDDRTVIYAMTQGKDLLGALSNAGVPIISSVSQGA